MAKIIVLTDIHIVPEGDTIIGLDPSARLDAAIDSIHERHGDADLVVVTGDLTHHGDAASYARLKASLSRLRLPSVLLIGNHDDRATFLAAFPGATVDADGFVQSWRDVGDVRLVFLDTVKTPPREGRYHSGIYCERRRAWLDRTLTEAGARPVLLFMHHPPHKIGFAGMDAIRLEDEEAFHAVIAKHRNVRHIFAGHIHRTISGTHRGIPFAVFKSTVHQQPLPFDLLDTKVSNAEPAAYGIVFATAETILVHTDDFELSASLPLLA